MWAGFYAQIISLVRNVCCYYRADHCDHRSAGTVLTHATVAAAGSIINSIVNDVCHYNGFILSAIGGRIRLGGRNIN